MGQYDDRFPMSLEPRPLRFEWGQTSAADLVREALARLHREHGRTIDDLSTSLALTHFQLSHLRRELGRSGGADLAPSIDALEILAANLQETLDRHRVRVTDLTDQTWTPALRETADVRGHSVNPKLAEPRVSHVETPVVHRDDRLLAKGVVLIETPSGES